ncbi:hypothetical protein AMAG_09459 [Allomyces macrogynus ATCC 38327]|uniref:K Homology domain-containing protein n=1 Tax=Allomyces macrogynus (strain ATCC 38327) TaxID=578462 RepID=A0A0L0SPM3_ALLM3|nr:hypothetical protein AMAG_09459 [Allomyces macrogynus ATCC 38327]|eukprot:KNE64437.1 hypothetical protein AMAG_09459 [Allomyces macrogynus ATCC 38327]
MASYDQLPVAIDEAALGVDLLAQLGADDDAALQQMLREISAHEAELAANYPMPSSASAPAAVGSGANPLLAAHHDDDLINALMASPAAVAEPKSKKNVKKQEKIDLASAEAFPTLGGPAAAPKSVFSSWSNRTTLAQTTGKSTAAASVSSAHKFSESVTVDVDDVVPVLVANPDQMSKALREVARKSETTISMTKRTGALVFTVSGKTRAKVEAGAKLVLPAVCPKITLSVTIPASARGLIVGSGGATIKGLQDRTATKIDFPRTSRTGEDESAAADTGAASPEPEAVANDDESDDSDAETDDASDDLYALARRVPIDEDEPSIAVTITGAKHGVHLARDEILSIVGPRAAVAKAKIGTDLFPTTLYPFLRGVRNARVHDLEAQWGVKIHVPPTSSTDENSVIVLAGDMADVRAARERLVDVRLQLEQSTTSADVTIEKRKHRFLVGADGAHLAELMEKTGCVLDIPAANDASTSVTVRGPSATIGEALALTLAKANAVSVAELDLVPHCAARDATLAPILARYLAVKDRAQLAAIESAHGAEIMVPREPASTVVEIVAKSLDAANAVKAQLQAHIAGKGLFLATVVPIPSELHRHAAVKAAVATARDALPESAEIATVSLKADGDLADELAVVMWDPTALAATKKGKKPAQAAIAAATAALKTHADAIVAAAKDAAEIAVEVLEAPRAVHKYILGAKGANLKAIHATAHAAGGEVPLTIALGKPETADQVLVRGLKDEVKVAANKIKVIVQAAAAAAEQPVITKEFDISSKYSAHIIGKGGVHMARFMDQIGVQKVEVGNATPGAATVKVTIQGTASAAKDIEKQIREKVANLEDQTTTTLAVPAEYHRSIIGQQGKYVKRLEEKYSVRIHFPRSGSPAGADGEDTAPTRGNAHVTDPNSIVVSGSRKGVKEASAEIMELVEYERSTSFEDSISVPVSAVPSLIGKGGARISQLKQLTNAKIDMPRPDADATELVVKIAGAREDVQLAKQVIKHAVTTLEASGMTWDKRTVTVAQGPAPPPDRARRGRRFASSWRRSTRPRRRLRPRLPARRAVRPRPACPRRSRRSSAVSLPWTATARSPTRRPTVARSAWTYGSPSRVRLSRCARRTAELLDSAIELLETKVASLEGEITVVLRLPAAVLPTIIGRGGSGVRELQTACGVHIDITRRAPAANEEPEPIPEDRDDLLALLEGEKPQVGTVLIRGPADKAQAAVATVFSKIPYSVNVTVPGAQKRRVLANGGAHLKTIRKAHQVQVDLPPRGTGPDAANADEVWTIRGDRESVLAARAALETVIEQVSAAPEGPAGQASGNKGPRASAAPQVVREIDDIPQHHHRHIIGKGGNTITQIRMVTNTFIDVPKRDSGSEVIKVSGPSDADVDEAVQMIREAVERGLDKKH